MLTLWSDGNDVSPIDFSLLSSKKARLIGFHLKSTSAALVSFVEQTQF